MKTKIIVAVITLTLLSGLNSSFSQIAFNKKSNNTRNSVFTSNAFAPSIKVQRTFIAYYGLAAENNWSMVGNNFLNRFHSNGLLTKALFARNGYLIYVIAYGTEKNLPADVRKIVKREYYDYAITKAIEVKENKRDIWVVKLENATEHVTVRVEDGEMERVQQFRKQTK